MLKIEFSQIIKEKVPHFRVLQIEASLTNPPTSDELWNDIENTCQHIKKGYLLSELNKRPAIAATREAYKKLGKDPNRYRPSAEALGRRVINGKGIYRLTTLIDVINLISLKSGHSIGGFDAEKIDGETLILDAGNKNDVFNAIGRGLLNIEGLPVYRDAKGGIGTPTSDEERTKLTPETKKLLMLVNIYDPQTDSEELAHTVREILEKHTDIKEFQSRIIKID